MLEIVEILIKSIDLDVHLLFFVVGNFRDRADRTPRINLDRTDRATRLRQRDAVMQSIRESHNDS